MPLLLLSSCCIDYEQQRDDPSPVRETADRLDTASPELECDGLDDDGDGLVDEGFPDLDGDGVADCVDDTCPVEPVEADAHGESPACAIPLLPSVEPWAVEVMWEARGGIGGCYTGTAVADMDGDGFSDVLCAGSGEIAVFSGEDGSLLWTYGPVAAYSPLAVADLDGDGEWNVVALGLGGTLAALNSDGTELWIGDVSLTELVFDRYADSEGLEVADLEGDGSAEVVAGHGVARAEDGHTAFLLEEAWWEDPYVPVLALADLSGDGRQEIVLGNMLFDANGSLRWDLTLESNSEFSSMPTLVQTDSDDEAELVLSTLDGWYTIVDSGGGILLQDRLAVDGSVSGRPCAGDVDGDDAMEVVIPGNRTVTAFEPGGTVLWSVPIYDPSSYVGCSVFDLDSDGADDVLIGDEQYFYILDGRTGAVRFRDDARSSATAGDTPMVADLDGDGSVEIIVPSACGSCDHDVAIRVYSNINRDWPPGSPIWPSATWSGTSMFVDGSIPRTPEPSWLTTKVWRGQPETMITGWDLRPEIRDSCASSCDPEVGRVTLALRLANLGPQELQRGAPVAVYGLGQDGTPSLLEVRWFHEFIDNGWASATVELELGLEQAMRGIVVKAGDDGSGVEVTEDCDQRNNVVSWRLDACD